MRRARLPILVVAVAVLLGCSATALVLASDHVAHPARVIPLMLLLGWSFTGAGAMAWWRRPRHSFAHLMIAVGLLSFVGALTAADDPWVFTFGVLFGDLGTAVVVQAILSYPEGRLHARAERVLVVATYLLVTLGTLGQLLVGDLSRSCRGGGCPRNVLLVDVRPGLAETLAGIENWIGVAIGIGVVVVLARRYRDASPRRRLALFPMLATSGVTAVLFIAQLTALQVSERVGDGLHWATMISLALVPHAFVLGLLRSELAGLSVGELLVQLGRGVEPGRLQGALAGALRDPSLAVAYWVPTAGGWADQDGARVELPEARAGRVVTEIERDGRRVAALVHDPALLDEPGLLDSVTAAAGLMLVNERLQAELRAHANDLERERDYTRAVVETVPSLLLVADIAGRIVEFNAACEQLSGFMASEARGRTIWELLVPPDEAAALQAAFDPELLPNEHENHWVTRSGEQRLILWRNTAVRDEAGNVEFVIGGGLDITERKAREAEVKAQRARIVEAADLERRRLERNLHDGAQQRLVSLSLTLRLARGRVRSEAAEAEQLLDAAADELALALAELRELARGIHPAILTDRGLAPALDALVARTSLPVDVEAPGDSERLPGPVEAAAYYVVSEALANASKYAQASTVSVSIRRVNGHAVVEVRDDGIGGADPEAGTGLRGLRDRVEALDGALSIESLAGAGTTVRAELPCVS